MKRFVLSMVLVFGFISTALALPLCYPSRPANAGPVQYLTPAYLSNWWATHVVPSNVVNPDYYVAFHATDAYCKAHYGQSAWAVITGPYALANNINGTIWGGAYFQCQKCSNVLEPAPGDPVEAR